MLNWKDINIKAVVLGALFDLVGSLANSFILGAIISAALWADQIPLASQAAHMASPKVLALAVISGLVTSTLLTLVVIPCVYEVIDGVTWFKQKNPVESLNR